MYKAPFLIRSRHNDYVAFLEDQKQIWEAGNTPARATEKLREAVRGYIRVLPIENDTQGISGIFGFIEFRGVDTFSILVFDMDGGLAGPYEIPHSRVEWIELKPIESAWSKFWRFLAGLIFGDHESVKVK